MGLGGVLARCGRLRFRLLVGGLMLAVIAAGAAPTSGFAHAAEPSVSSFGRHSQRHVIKPLLPGGEVTPRPFSRWPRIPVHLAEPDAGAAIVGGTGALQGALGFTAFVIYTESRTSVQFCSGTVVSANVVLTAGHCAVDQSTGSLLDPSKFAVVTGSVDWTDSSLRQLSAVSRIIVDPAYDPATHSSDAALLVLSTPTTAPSIPLASSANLALEHAGTGAVITGWGDTYEGSGPADVLQWAETVVQRPAYCDQFSQSYDPALQLCTVNYPYDDTATCSGDSGGPLLATDADGQPVEIGITSYGPTDCDTVRADFFTAVAPLSSWANQEIQAAAPPPPPPAKTTTTTPTTTTAPTTSPPASTAPQLPRMTRSVARSYTTRALAGALGRAFERRDFYKPFCSRVSSTRFNCGFTFWSTPNDYYGNVTVQYTNGSGGKVYWTDHYTARWVNDYCYFHSGHRHRCKTHTKRGSW